MEERREKCGEGRGREIQENNVISREQEDGRGIRGKHLEGGREMKEERKV